MKLPVNVTCTDKANNYAGNGINYERKIELSIINLQLTNKLHLALITYSPNKHPNVKYYCFIFGLSIE